MTEIPKEVMDSISEESKVFSVATCGKPNVIYVKYLKLLDSKTI